MSWAKVQLIGGTLVLLATPAWQAGKYLMWMHGEVADGTVIV